MTSHLSKLKVTSRTFAMCVITIMTLVLFVQMLGKACRPQGYDFTAYLLAAEAVWTGGNPYELDMPFPYIYPLTLSTLLIPLTVIPYWLANVIWFVIGLAGLFAAVFVVVTTARRYLEARNFTALIPWLGVLYLLLLHPIQQNLLNGQANFLSLGLLAIFLSGLTLGLPFIAALGLAAAIAVKLLPAILLVFLVVDRRIYTAALAGLLTLALLLVPVLVVGTAITNLYGDYADSFLFTRLSGASVQFPGPAFSLSSTLAQSYRGLEDGLWLKGISALTLLFPVVAVHWRSRATRNTFPVAPDPWIVCLYLVLIPLVSPMSEAHHLAFVLPGAVLVSLRCVMVPSDSLYRRGAVVVFWTALLFAPFLADGLRNAFYWPLRRSTRHFSRYQESLGAEWRCWLYHRRNVTRAGSSTIPSSLAIAQGTAR